VARAFVIAGVVVLVLLVSVALAGLLVVSNTDYGRERVRRFAESAGSGRAKHGVVKLGRVSGNLLEGFTIADVSIRDSAGAPFLVADTVSLNYGLRALLLKHLELADVRLVRPLVVLDKPPGDSTLVELQGDLQERHPEGPARYHQGALRRLDRTARCDGPRWSDDDPLAVEAEQQGTRARSGTARSRTQVAGKERVVVERRGDAYQKIIEFRSFNGEIPYLRPRAP
jgi:hypothetical protein